jgi:hypothetical protein
MTRADDAAKRNNFVGFDDALRACSVKFNADFHQSWDDHYINSTNAAATFIPLVLAWLLVYGLVGLVSWIKGGFAE